MWGNDGHIHAYVSSHCLTLNIAQFYIGSQNGVILCRPTSCKKCDPQTLKNKSYSHNCWMVCQHNPSTIHGRTNITAGFPVIPLHGLFGLASWALQHSKKISNACRVQTSKDSILDPPPRHPKASLPTLPPFIFFYWLLTQYFLFIFFFSFYLLLSFISLSSFSLPTSWWRSCGQTTF